MAVLEGFVRTVVPRAVRNFLRSPTRSVRWAWEESRYLLGMTARLELRPGWMVYCHPTACRVANEQQRTDPDQVVEFDRFIALCRPGMVLLDVGAHFGLFSLASLHYGGPTAVSIAVDPSPSASRIMKIQARLNHVEDRLRVVEAVASDRTGWHQMVAVGVLADGFFVPPSAHHSARDVKRARAVTLDELAQDFKVVPTHIKIDVEGQEAQVLRGSHRLLSGHDGPILFVELHNRIIRERSGDPAETLALLKEHGYRVAGRNGTMVSDAAVLSEPLIRIVAAKNGALAAAR